MPALLFLLAGAAALAFVVSKQSGASTPPMPKGNPPPPDIFPGSDLQNTHYFDLWVLERGCMWTFLQQGWNLDGVAEITAAHRNTPVFFWMWDADKYYAGQQPWTSGVVDRFRAASIGCCKDIGGC